MNKLGRALYRTFIDYDNFYEARSFRKCHRVIVFVLYFNIINYLCQYVRK